MTTRISSPRDADALLDPSSDLLGHVLVVSDVHDETADASSISFTIPEYLCSTFEFQAGQFLTLAIPSDREGWVARCYSISSSPGGGHLAVTVKRTAGGYASNWLLDNLVAGASVRVLPPSGLFTLRSPESDVLLCAAGSGITPAMSILRTVLESRTGRVALFYANRDARSIIFRHELEQLQQQHPKRLVVEHWLEDERGGLPAEEAVSDWAAGFREREVLVCGPAPFMHLIHDAVARAGFDPMRVRNEEYRSLTGDPFAPLSGIDESELSDASRVDVMIDGQTHVLAWPGTHTLVDVMVASGIDTPYACREGKCGACTCELTEGTVDLGRTDALEREDVEAGFILACQAKPSSSLLKVEF